MFTRKSQQSNNDQPARKHTQLIRLVTRFRPTQGRRLAAIIPLTLAIMFASLLSIHPSAAGHADAAVITPCTLSGPFFTPTWQGAPISAHAAMFCPGAPVGTYISMTIEIKQSGVTIARNYNNRYAGSLGIWTTAPSLCGRGVPYQAVVTTYVTGPGAIPAAAYVTTGMPHALC